MHSTFDKTATTTTTHGRSTNVTVRSLPYMQNPIDTPMTLDLSMQSDFLPLTTLSARFLPPA